MVGGRGGGVVGDGSGEFDGVLGVWGGMVGGCGCGRCVGGGVGGDVSSAML